MSRSTTKIEFQGEVLRSLMTSREIKFDQFGGKVGVSRQTVSTWISENRIPPRRLLDLKKALSISPDEFEQLTRRTTPEIQIQFRTLKNVAVSESIKEDVGDVAKEYFRLDTTRIDRKDVKTVLQSSDPVAMAESIVHQLNLHRYKLSLESTILALEAHNIHVVFYDFGPEFVEENAQAACARSGDNAIIFINAHEAIEDVLWRIFHETCHLFSNHREISKEQEDFCNLVATEVVTPQSFFLANANDLKKQFKSIKRAPLLAKEIARILSAGFSGVIMSLSRHKIIDSGTEKYLWGCFHRFKASRTTVLGKIKPQGALDPIVFWRESLVDPEKSKFLKFQILAQKALLEDRISIGRASEIFGVDEKSVEELAAEWQMELLSELDE